MGDKDAEGLLAAFEPHLAHVVCTQNSTDARDARRASSPRSRARSTARTGSPSQPRLADAIDQAAALAEAGEAFGDLDRCRRACW